MLYFAQAMGEAGASNAGFGKSSRTTIFDYWGIPSLQRWVNNGTFDGGQLTHKERHLRDFYSRLLTFSSRSPALTGNYLDIHTANRNHSPGYDDSLFSFARWKDDDRLIIVSNFSDTKNYSIELQLPATLIKQWQLKDGEHALTEQLYGSIVSTLVIQKRAGKISLKLKPLESFILKLEWFKATAKFLPFIASY